MDDKMSLLSILVILPVATSQILCPEAQGFYPDPFHQNCQTYIMCNEFVPLRTACPGGLGFDPISRTCRNWNSFNCGAIDVTTTSTTILPETSPRIEPTLTQDPQNVTDISQKYCPHIKTILDRMLLTIIRSVVAADGDCQKNCTLPTIQLTCK